MRDTPLHLDAYLAHVQDSVVHLRDLLADRIRNSNCALRSSSVTLRRGSFRISKGRVSTGLPTASRT